MTNKEHLDPVEAGKRSYEEWRAELHADPEYQKIYDEEAAKSELWLQLVEARKAAGLTQAQMAERLGVSQAQVARMEKRGYDAHTLKTLRRYVEALGEGYSLEVRVHTPNEYPQDQSSHRGGFVSA
jgi:DNA-binding XRE family transcriptional regulator